MAIEFKNVSFKYNDFDKNTIVKEVKVDVSGSLNAQIKNNEEVVTTNTLNIVKIDSDRPEIEILINENKGEKGNEN